MLHFENKFQKKQLNEQQILIAEYNKLKQALVSDNLNVISIQRNTTNNLNQIFMNVKTLIGKMGNKYKTLKNKYNIIRKRLRNYQNFDDSDQLVEETVASEVTYKPNYQHSSHISSNHINQIDGSHKNQSVKKKRNGHPKLEEQNQYNRALNNLSNISRNDGRLQKQTSWAFRQDKKAQLKKEQWAFIGKFVKQFLIPRVIFDSSRTSSIPKKIVLHMYLEWCKLIDRTILVDKTSTVQMALTNELKIAFPQIDSFHNDYKGLKFNKELQDYSVNLEKKQNEYQEENEQVEADNEQQLNQLEFDEDCPP